MEHIQHTVHQVTESLCNALFLQRKLQWKLPRYVHH